ncbi:nucleoside phosphorylase (plasmid) [Arthrobacter agilis]|uniref:nucleoside phosphorylase n=1 Tax=Arthrobacter agilis TaxID=37921 RepID=UPI0023651EC0|nr:nucleoside phosphorylase [Arthrobacter agilis]WDF35246.1 nucleoside phosphorylase [Arthrobacter agilis]
MASFDSDRDSFISPRGPRVSEPMPDRAVLCFFPEVLDAWHQDGKIRAVGAFDREIGQRPIYVHDPQPGSQEQPVAVFHPGVGAPLAVHSLEQIIAAGTNRFVVCGGAGSLSSHFPRDAVLVVDEAVRDEGTSYHYAPAARSIRCNEPAISHAMTILAEQGVPAVRGKTWTTDATYRETPRRIAERVTEGCLAVEMEASALAAAAAFRDVSLVQFVYSGDDLSGDAWRDRNWQNSSTRSRLLELALLTARAM